MQKISFEGKSNLFISNDVFDKVSQKYAIQTRRTPQIKQKYHIGEHRTIKIDTSKGDMFVILRNEREGYIRSFLPLGKMDDIIESVAKRVEELKRNASENITAWILGGPKKQSTIDAVNQIGEVLCDRHDIDTSILAGADKMPATTMIIDGHVGSFDIVFPKEEKSINNINDLENHFQIAEFNNVQTKID